MENLVRENSKLWIKEGKIYFCQTGDPLSERNYQLLIQLNYNDYVAKSDDNLQFISLNTYSGNPYICDIKCNPKEIVPVAQGKSVSVYIHVKDGWKWIYTRSGSYFDIEVMDLRGDPITGDLVEYSGTNIKTTEGSWTVNYITASKI